MKEDNKNKRKMTAYHICGLPNMLSLVTEVKAALVIPKREKKYRRLEIKRETSQPFSGCQCEK